MADGIINRDHERYKNWQPYVINRLERLIVLGFATDMAEDLARSDVAMMRIEGLRKDGATHTQIWDLLAD